MTFAEKIAADCARAKSKHPAVLESEIEAKSRQFVTVVTGGTVSLTYEDTTLTYESEIKARMGAEKLISGNQRIDWERGGSRGERCFGTVSLRKKRGPR